MGLGKTITTLALIRSPNSGEGVIDPPEEPAEDPKRRYSDTTLIVCPLSVIGNWRDQIRMHVGGSNECNYHVYHGKEAKVSNSFLRNCDVVITTYQTLANEYIVDKDGELVRKKAKKPKKDQKLENGTLYKVKWRRIVLDEGHIIRNRKTQAFKAAKAIYAERRWSQFFFLSYDSGLLVVSSHRYTDHQQDEGFGRYAGFHSRMSATGQCGGMVAVCRSSGCQRQTGRQCRT